MKTAAIYARVSSDQQKEDKTIASQTAALVAFASSQGYSVPAEWIFEDEGFSGATLVRPGLERVRDLVAEGQVHAVLVLSPDRLSRKYAYQVLLTEEWLRHGVQTIFIKAPQSQTPEDQLLLQFQGMIAEYERAQILERSRRGKRHRAKQGEVSVLSGAPYGYRYVRKTEERAAYYEVIEAQAEVVRQVFDLYTAQALSIGAITRRLNELAVPTRKEQACWERTTIWAMLRNPAYRGTACFGKTQEATRQDRDNRAVRLRVHPPRRAPRPLQEAPKDQWIQIPVPALVDERTFDLAQERLQDNKRFSPRRTVEPSILQGLVHCAQCGYALYRTSTRSSARKIYYYRCLGSDAWRYQGQARCSARAIRLDLLEDTVWAEVARLLEDPALIQAELTRRLEAARTSHPAQQNQDRITRELLLAQRRVERLMTAYQEDLLSLDELRRRMPELRQRETRLKAELESLSAQLADQATYLRLAHTLGEFLERLRTQVQGLDVLERQRVVRLLVKEVVVGDDGITIRHSIPHSDRSSGGPAGRVDPGVPLPGGDGSGASLLLRTWRDLTVAGKSLHAPVRVGVEEVRVRQEPWHSDRDLRRRSRDPLQEGPGRRGLAANARTHGQAEADGQRREDTNLQGAGRRVRLPGIHLRADVLAEDWQGPLGHEAVEEEYPAHGRKGPCADRPEDGMARDHGGGGQVESGAARLGELLPSGDHQRRVPGARQLHRTAVASVAAHQAQGQATPGRGLSSLAPVRVLRARESDQLEVRRVVGEGVTSCPRAGCGSSARPVR
jgi:site-specific DNA recombinase